MKPKYKDPRAYRKNLLSVAEAQYCMECSGKTVINYYKKGILKGHRAEQIKGSKIYIDRNSLIEFLRLD